VEEEKVKSKLKSGWKKRMLLRDKAKEEWRMKKKALRNIYFYT